MAGYGMSISGRANAAGRADMGYFSLGGSVQP